MTAAYHHAQRANGASRRSASDGSDQAQYQGSTYGATAWYDATDPATASTGVSSRRRRCATKIASTSTAAAPTNGSARNTRVARIPSSAFGSCHSDARLTSVECDVIGASACPAIG